MEPWEHPREARTSGKFGFLSQDWRLLLARPGLATVLTLPIVGTFHVSERAAGRHGSSKLGKFALVWKPRGITQKFGLPLLLEALCIWRAVWIPLGWPARAGAEHGGGDAAVNAVVPIS